MIDFSTGLTFSCQRSLDYKDMPNDLPCKSIDCFLYDRDLRYERVKNILCARAQAFLVNIVSDP